VKNKIKILIAEDEVIIAQWLKFELEDIGYEVFDYVTTGEEAFKITKEKNPDIVLLDISLSGEIDGIEAAHRIRDNLNIPIVFMTGYTESGIYERAQKVKPLAFLEKPVEIHTLKPVIDSYFNEKS